MRQRGQSAEGWLEEVPPAQLRDRLLAVGCVRDDRPRIVAVHAISIRLGTATCSARSAAVAGMGYISRIVSARPAGSGHMIATSVSNAEYCRCTVYIFSGGSNFAIDLTTLCSVPANVVTSVMLATRALRSCSAASSWCSGVASCGLSYGGASCGSTRDRCVERVSVMSTVCPGVTESPNLLADAGVVQTNNQRTHTACQLTA